MDQEIALPALHHDKKNPQQVATQAAAEEQESEQQEGDFSALAMAQKDGSFTIYEEGEPVGSGNRQQGKLVVEYITVVAWILWHGEGWVTDCTSTWRDQSKKPSRQLS